MELEIEETAELLNLLSNKSGICERDRKKVFAYLEKAKVLTSKALKLEETSKAFVVEKGKLRDDETSVRQAFYQWIEIKDIVNKGLYLQFYEQMKTQIQRFVIKTKKFDRLKEMAHLYLELMHLVIKDLKGHLSLMAQGQVLGTGSSIELVLKYLKQQMECVQKAIEDASAQEVFVVDFIRKIEVKLKHIHFVLDHPEKVEECRGAILTRFEEEEAN